MRAPRRRTGRDQGLRTTAGVHPVAVLRRRKTHSKDSMHRELRTEGDRN